MVIIYIAHKDVSKKAIESNMGFGNLFRNTFKAESFLTANFDIQTIWSV